MNKNPKIQPETSANSVPKQSAGSQVSDQKKGSIPKSRSFSPADPQPTQKPKIKVKIKKNEEARGKVEIRKRSEEAKEKSKKLTEDLREKAHEIEAMLQQIKKWGLTKTQLLDYLSNQKNFPISDWEEIYKKVKEFQAPLVENLLTKTDKKNKTGSKQINKPLQKVPKKRFAAEKRKWIPMP